MTAAAIICGLCDRPARVSCWGGECVYLDGSSLICPNWQKKSDEIAGLDPEEEERWRRMHR